MIFLAEISEFFLGYNLRDLKIEEFRSPKLKLLYDLISAVFVHFPKLFAS